ncbi:MAG: hypothetical protein MPJ24_11735 [Pirellulaceae bacterium]|nr:hypothetical protein [Pirellulaceae bacterium]
MKLPRFRFQFGIKTLLILTAIFALICITAVIFFRVNIFKLKISKQFYSDNSGQKMTSGPSEKWNIQVESIFPLKEEYNWHGQLSESCFPPREVETTLLIHYLGPSRIIPLWKGYTVVGHLYGQVEVDLDALSAVNCQSLVLKSPLSSGGVTHLSTIEVFAEILPIRVKNTKAISDLKKISVENLFEDSQALFIHNDILLDLQNLKTLRSLSLISVETQHPHYYMDAPDSPLIRAAKSFYDQRYAMTSEQIEALLSLESLEYLHIYFVDEDCKRIATHPTLKEINLQKTIISPEGVDKLLDSKSLEKITLPRWHPVGTKEKLLDKAKELGKDIEILEAK